MRAKPKISKDGAKGLWVVGGFYVNRKRKRQYFSTKVEAEIHLARIKAQIEREGQEAWSITAAERADAAKAIGVLRPLGVSLVDAARFYAVHLEATSRSISFSDLVAKLLAAREGDGRSGSHLVDLRWRLNRFAQTFGQRLVAEISFTEIDDWLRALPYAPQGRMNFRKVLHGAFAFAVHHEYCDINPVSKTTRISVKKGPPAVLSPKQMRALLAKAPNEIIPYITISGFAGLRTSEINGLDWSCINLARSRIEVKAIHKTGHRWVDIVPNLARWLAPFKRDAGPVTPKKAIRIRKAAAQAAGIHWQNNCLRHSFGSAHAVLYGDLVRTSSQMGNTPRVLLEHYRRLITPEEAKEWFSILPPDHGNIIALGAQTA